jgi:long-chain acyl-CoA synthetase
VALSSPARYPQECEDLLITHPKVGDAAVFGVPNADLGEEVMPDPQPHITAVTRFPKVEMIP